MKVSKDAGSIEQPEPGIHQAILCEVIDLGKQENMFRPGTYQNKALFVFQLKTPRSTGQRFLVNDFVTVSMNEKSRMRKIVAGMLGKRFSTAFDEHGDLDLDTLCGTNCMLTLALVDPNESKVKIESVSPLPATTELITAEGYERPAWIAGYLAETAEAEKEPL